MITIDIRNIKTKDYLPAIDVIKKSITYSLGKIYPKKLIDEFCKKYDLPNFKKKVLEIKYFVAEEINSHTILGIIGLKNNDVRTFFVHPDYQGKGVGHQLYNKLEQEARKIGIKELIIEGSPLGEPIYKHFGFKKLKILHKERAGIKYEDAFLKKTLL